jgi:mannose-6-phosphate isomerase-like protein (cupin superfamily)
MRTVSSHTGFRIEGLQKRAEGCAAELRDPGALGGPMAGASFVAGVAGALALADAPYPRPGAEPADVRRYFGGNPGAARLSAAGQLISAASLARFAGSVADLASRSDRGSRGLRVAAVVGGALAAASLATSALCAAALTARRGEEDAHTASLHRLMFATGGPVHGAGFGLLVGSLGLAGLRTGELPVPLVITGLASAAVGLLSLLYFVWEPAAWLIPAGRFPGLVVSAIAGARLSRR